MQNDALFDAACNNAQQHVLDVAISHSQSCYCVEYLAREQNHVQDDRLTVY